MPFRLLKARINCNYNRIIKPFKTLENFTNWTDNTDFSISQIEPFSDSNLESASVRYSTSYQSSTVDIKLNLMQSTGLTSYCFDVFLMINYAELNSAAEAIIALYRVRLDALRYQYNGDWIIADSDLTLTNLK